MKILSKIALIFILGGIVFLNATCSKQKWFKKVTYEGRIYDSLGGHPIQRVYISLNACDPSSHNDECNNFSLGQTSTDAEGHFSIHNKAARSNRYDIVVKGTHISPFFRISGDELSSSKYTTLYLNKLPI